MTAPPWLSQPNLHYRSQVMEVECPVPAKPGLYGWFFKTIPPRVPTEDCLTYDGLTLFYLGISPKPPSAAGKPSTGTLRNRIRGQHHGGNAAGSTLRLTLGCLLAEITGFPLRRVGGGKRMTFTHRGEQALDRWLSDNAFVAWHVDDSPWIAEAQLIRQLSVPLNIENNQGHPFYKTLKSIRAAAKLDAREADVADEAGTTRSGR